MKEKPAAVYLALATNITAAYVSKNRISPADLPKALADVYAALRSIGEETSRTRGLRPPVPIKNSITPSHLVSLEDGKPYKTLKRHLARHGLTPAAYRDKWGLPSDYPMEAPNYAARRTQQALTRYLGLGGSGPEPARHSRPKRGGLPGIIGKRR